MLHYFDRNLAKGNFSSNELGLTNYEIFCCDKLLNISLFEWSGGVLVAIHKDIHQFIPPFFPLHIVLNIYL